MRICSAQYIVSGAPNVPLRGATVVMVNMANGISRQKLRAYGFSDFQGKTSVFKLFTKLYLASIEEST